MNPLNKSDKNQKLVIMGIVLLVFVLGGGFFLSQRSSKLKTSDSEESILPTTQVFPTVDASVVVNLAADRLKREVTLTINGVPTGTKTIDYELSYIAEGNLPKGVIGTIEVFNKRNIEKDGITLGTCSSGACVYDKGVESVNVYLKFNGDYGAKIFEGKFEI